MGLQGVTRGYRGSQGATGGYKGLQGVTSGYRGLQRVNLIFSVIRFNIAYDRS